MVSNKYYLRFFLHLHPAQQLSSSSQAEQAAAEKEGCYIPAADPHSCINLKTTDRRRRGNEAVSQVSIGSCEEKYRKEKKKRDNVGSQLQKLEQN